MKILFYLFCSFFGIFSKLISTAIPYVLAFTLSTTAMAFQASQKNAMVQGSVNTHELEKLADSLSNIFLEKDLVPGMTVAIAKNGEILFARGYGEADLELKVPSSPETVYRIGSITKQFTAAIIMKLAEEGKIFLDDPITKHLPEYRTQGNFVRVRHLLNHTSGINGIRGRMVDEKTRQQFRLDLSDEEITALFANEAFDFAPGEQFRYNNSGYFLLGQIIGKVTGTSYKDYVEQQFLPSLGLDDTGYDSEKIILPNRARGYEREEKVRINAPYISMNIPGAAGAFYSTVSDLVKWTHLLHSGKVVSEKSLKKMLAPTSHGEGKVASYGYGLSLGAVVSNKRVFHTGKINGFTSVLSYYPDAGITVVVLTNTGEGEPIAAMEEALARKALNVKVLDLPVAQKEISRYEGLYTYTSGDKHRELQIFGKEEQLLAQLVGGKSFKLLFQGDNIFIPEVDQNTKFVFTKNGLEIHDGPYERMIAEKTKK